MNKKRIYLYGSLLILVFIVWVLSDSAEKNNEKSEVAKIALREVGHQLLLANQDTASLVLPIIELEASKYKLSFQNQLSIEPVSLVSIVKKSFQKAGLSEFYIVEVIQCKDNEVAYSYKMMNKNNKSIVPCGGRYLPKNCYTIEARFLNRTTSSLNKKILLFVLCIIIIIFLIDVLYNTMQKQTTTTSKTTQNHASIGSFRFYPEQNKLIKEAVEIQLSKKECELLVIFAARPNQIIKRDELTKKVWEDNGVIVGRSLDTYISKLRKKLKDDDSIKLTNVHGVGYKLEIV